MTTPGQTGLLTATGLLIRDLESFGPRFWGSEGTLTVPFGLSSDSFETEIAGGLAGSSQILPELAINAKCPAADLWLSGVNWSPSESGPDN